MKRLAPSNAFQDLEPFPSFQCCSLTSSDRPLPRSAGTIAIIRPNAAGVIVWEPSLMACSGSSCTSMIKASAPAAMAALAHGRDQPCLAGSVRRVDDNRQMALFVEVGNGRQRQA